MRKETQPASRIGWPYVGKKFSEKPKDVSPISIPPDANAPHGERGDFLKVTATLSPEVYKLVSDEMQRRKLAREPNAQLSAILREAVLAYLMPSRRV